MTVSLLLDPQRAARLVYFGSSDSGLPDLEEVLNGLIDRTWKNEQYSGTEAEINRTVSFVVLDNLFGLATTRSSPMQVKAITHQALKALKAYLETAVARDSSQKAAYGLAVDLIENYLEDPEKIRHVHQQVPPPGSPIGSCQSVH
jgi:hypothetical protein